MLLTSTDGASVQLRPTRYQFATPPLAAAQAGDCDANWLQVQGVVHAATGQTWTFDQPCLQTTEARELGDWLRLAAGDVAITQAPDEDSQGMLTFTEPNLGFSIAAHRRGSLVVRVHLAHSSAPDLPWPKEWDHDESLHGLPVLTVPLHTDGLDVLDAARTWDDDLAPFPHRPANRRR